MPPYVQFVRVKEDRAILSTPINNMELNGTAVELVSRLVPLLHEGATVEELTSELRESEETIKKLLVIIAETGQLHTGKTEYDDFWRWALGGSDTKIDSLNGSKIGILTTDPCSFPEIENSVQIPVDDTDDLRTVTDNIDIFVSITNGIRPRLHRDLSETILEANLPWLPMRLVGGEIHFGPLTNLDSSACYDCFYSRYVASRSEPKVFRKEQRKIERSDSYPPYPSSVYLLAGAIAAFEVSMALIRHHHPNTIGSLVRYDLFEHEMTYSDIESLPGCEACAMN